MLGIVMAIDQGKSDPILEIGCLEFGEIQVQECRQVV